MVDVISQETRAEALRQQQQLESQRQSLESRRRGLSTASTLRSLSREGQINRQKQLQSLNQTSELINQNVQELQRISSLPTPDEIGGGGSFSNSEIALARKLASEGKSTKGIPLSALKDKRLRALVIKIKEGQTPDQIVSAYEQQNFISLTPKARNELISNNKLFEAGAIPQDIRANQSLPRNQFLLAQGYEIDKLTLNPIVKSNEPINQKGFQGAVQRFTDPQYFYETGKQRQLPLVVSQGKSPFKFLIRDKKGKVKDINIFGAIREGAERSTSLINERLTTFVDEAPTLRHREKFKSLLNLKSPISSGQLAIDLLVSPVFATGSAQQLESEYIYDYISQRFIKKSEVKNLVRQRISDYAETLKESSKFKKLGITARGGNVATEGELRELARNQINQANGDLKVLKRLGEFYNKNGRPDIFKDIAEQEGIVFSKSVRRLLPIKVNQIAQGNIPSSSVITGTTSKITGSGRIGSYGGGEVGSYGNNRIRFTEETQYLGYPPGQRRLSPFAQNQKVLQNLQQNFRIEQLNLQKSLRTQGLDFSQVNKQLQQLRLQQRQELQQRSNQLSGQGLATAQSSRLTQRSRLQQRSRLGQRSRLSQPRPRLRPPRLRLPPPKLGLPDSAFGKRITTMVSKGTPQKFDIFAKRKGKLVRLNKKPITGSRNAKDYLANRLDTTLRASGIVRPSSRTGSMKLPTSITGYLNRNTRKFYTNPKTGFLVERRSFRLERTTRELPEIKSFPKPKYKSFKGKRL